MLNQNWGRALGKCLEPLYASWQSARAQIGLLRRPLSISLGVMTPLATGLAQPQPYSLSACPSPKPLFPPSPSPSKRGLNFYTTTLGLYGQLRRPVNRVLLTFILDVLQTLDHLTKAFQLINSSIVHCLEIVEAVRLDLENFKAE